MAWHDLVGLVREERHVPFDDCFGRARPAGVLDPSWDDVVRRCRNGRRWHEAIDSLRRAGHLVVDDSTEAMYLADARDAALFAVLLDWADPRGVHMARAWGTRPNVRRSYRETSLVLTAQVDRRPSSATMRRIAFDQAAARLDEWLRDIDADPSLAAPRTPTEEGAAWAV